MNNFMVIVTKIILLDLQSSSAFTQTETKNEE